MLFHVCYIRSTQRSSMNFFCPLFRRSKSNGCSNFNDGRTIRDWFGNLDCFIYASQVFITCLKKKGKGVVKLWQIKILILNNKILKRSINNPKSSLKHYHKKNIKIRRQVHNNKNDWFATIRNFLYMPAISFISFENILSKW